MNSWVRLYHDTPSDPKWRTIARKSGQRIGDVLAVWTFVLTNASANADERGRTHNFDTEDVAAALDLKTADVDAILSAMEGKVIANGKLPGWEKRNPIKDDGAAERAKAWRERKRTQTNGANALDKDTDKIREDKKEQVRDGWPTQAFDIFYEAYPHKVGKQAARKAFDKARKSNRVPWVELMGALGRYKSDKPPDRQWCNPATWLNEGRWEDQPAEVKSGTDRKNSVVDSARRLAEQVNNQFGSFSPFEIGSRSDPLDVRMLPQGGCERPGDLHGGGSGDPFGVRPGGDLPGDGPEDGLASADKIFAQSR